jgi:general secretion pathway protein D
VLIYPSTPAKQKDYQEMAVRAFFLTNIEAKTMANTIKAIIKSRDIVVDEKLNMIMIRDTPEAIKVAERLVALQDVAEPEVMLEVEVLEVQKTLLQNLGVGWPASLSVTPLPLGTNLANGSTGTGTTTTTGTTSTSSTLSLNDLLHQNRNSLGVTVGQASVNANLQDSDAKLLTNPRIRVRNHEKAKILIGERVPNITSTATSTGFVSQSINYIDVGLTLNVEPTIYLDDDVAIKVTLEVSSILNQFTTSSGTSAYEIGTRTASTVLQLKNGETDVLAGLIDNSESHSGNKIPGIGDFPILGRLFGSATDNDSKTEIVLSITPHLIRNIQRPNVNEANFRSGTESVMHSGPETDGVTVRTTASTPALPGIAIGGNVVDTPVASTGTAQLQWQGPSQVAVGNTVQVTLLMQATQGVDSVPLTLGFDAGKLQVVGVSEGPFLRQGGSPTSFSSRIGSGNITIADTSSSSIGATAQAAVATVTFRALAPTSATEVRLISAAPLSVSGTPITAAAPAPLTLQLVQP